MNDLLEDVFAVVGGDFSHTEGLGVTIPRTTPQPLPQMETKCPYLGIRLNYKRRRMQRDK